MSTGSIIAIAVAVVLIGLAVYFKLFSRLGAWWTQARTFLKETRAELTKVTFPSRDDVVATTIVVIIASLVFSIFLTLSDVVINKVYGFVFGMFG
jgi:preprotein translocase subunit SecE